MYWPEPVKRHFAGPGKILGAALAIVAAVYGALFAGLEGVAVLVAILVLALVVELWREDKRRADAMAQQDTRIGQLEKTVSERDDELQTIRDQREADQDEADEQMAALGLARLELEDAQQEAERLRDELASPVLNFESLIEGLSRQLAVIDLIQKHRRLQEEGLKDWPLMRLTLREDESVLAEAYVGEEAERLADELVSVVAAGDEYESGYRESSLPATARSWSRSKSTTFLRR